MFPFFFSQLYGCTKLHQRSLLSCMLYNVHRNVFFLNTDNSLPYASRSWIALIKFTWLISGWSALCASIFSNLQQIPLLTSHTWQPWHGVHFLPYLPISHPKKILKRIKHLIIICHETRCKSKLKSNVFFQV